MDAVEYLTKENNMSKPVLVTTEFRVVCPDCKNTYYGDRCIICYPTVVPANMGDALQKGALNKVVDKYHKDTIGLCSIVEFLDAYPIKSALCFDITQHECQDLAEEIHKLLKRHC